MMVTSKYGSVIMKYLSQGTIIAVLLFGFFVLRGSPLNPWQEAPGEGVAAAKSFRELAVVIQAVEKYKADNGTYPGELARLVPKYLPSLPDMSNKNRKSNVAYFSKENGTGFELSFSYSGPGTNHCTYSFPKGWVCHGAY